MPMKSTCTLVSAMITMSIFDMFYVKFSLEKLMLVDPHVKSLYFHVYSSNQAQRPTPVRLNIGQMDLCAGK